MPAQPIQIGYCTNVHAGPSLSQAKQNLIDYALPIRQKTLGNHADEDLGIGFWLPEPSALELASSDVEIDSFRQFLSDNRLRTFTINAFPQGDFHLPRVKHLVYEPTWWQKPRLEYTTAAANILSRLITPGSVGSISTLPISWGHPSPTPSEIEGAIENLTRIGHHLHQIHETQGRHIQLAIEAEPGCFLGESSKLRLFLHRQLFQAKDAEILRQHLTVCHDICHSAVMREDQIREIQSYRELGIRIGKIQVSSAIEVNWDRLTESEREQAFAQLSAFAEDRYLHQTTTRSGPVGSVRLAQDLSELVSQVTAPTRLAGNWAIHFHVPIFSESFGLLSSLRHEINQCLDALTNDISVSESGQLVTTNDFFSGHFEIETYAWNVLPEEFQPASLVEGISSEYDYFRTLISDHFCKTKNHEHA